MADQTKPTTGQEILDRVNKLGAMQAETHALVKQLHEWVKAFIEADGKKVSDKKTDNDSGAWWE